MASKTTEPPVPQQNDSQKSKGGTDQQMADSKEYVKNYLRVSKDCLYMIIALWMENFPVVPEKVKEDLDHHKVGAVLVLPNEIVCGADCSRDDVHAVARLLTKHHDKAEGSKMFMSRKPCPMCAKLLVQSKVKRVLFLPFQPEYYRLKGRDPAKENLEGFKDKQKTRVDSLFTASAIAQTKFTLQVEEAVVHHAKKDTPPHLENKVDVKKRSLIEDYGFDKEPGWKDLVQKKLPWPAFDRKLKEQFQIYFAEVMDWIATVLVMRGRGSDYKFELFEDSKNPTDDREVFNLVANDKQARHFIAIARFLAERTDDTKTRVGAVIVSSKLEILGFGWNGFPLKAHYGEFGRGPSKSKDDKKYPYIIHAEQNALLMRNKKDIKGAILFVTKSPCNECAPLLAAEGIATIIVDDDVKHCDPPPLDKLGYNKFPSMVKEGKFVCYHTIKTPADPKGIPAKGPVKQVNTDEKA